MSQFEIVKFHWRHTFLTFVALLFTQTFAYAQTTDYSGGSLVDEKSHELDMDLLSKIYLVTEQYKFSLNNYIPTRGLPQNDDGNIIAQRIFQRTLQNFVDTYKDDKTSALGTAARVNNNMCTRVGPSDNYAVLFRFRPIEATAEISYVGALPFKSSISYEVARQETRFEVSKPLGNKTLGFTYAQSNTESVDLLHLRWSF